MDVMHGKFRHVPYAASAAAGCLSNSTIQAIVPVTAGFVVASGFGCLGPWLWAQHNSRSPRHDGWPGPASSTSLNRGEAACSQLQYMYVLHAVSRSHNDFFGPVQLTNRSSPAAQQRVPSHDKWSCCCRCAGPAYHCLEPGRPPCCQEVGGAAGSIAQQPAA
jgi:hypothetical protein